MLTKRERQALRAYATTGSYRLTGDELGLSEQTVRGYLARVRAKLGVPTTVQAVWIARASLEAA